MAPFRQYVLSLTAAALLGGILLSCVPEGSSRKILRLVCGILITVTALKPLGQLRLPDLDALTGEYRQQAEAAVATGQEMARLEAQGLADTRWRALEETAFAQKLTFRQESCLIFCAPVFVKVRWRGGEPLDAKTYLMAGVQ
jgi:hypothetical protein